MIWESSYWKDNLVKAAVKLRKRMIQKRWSPTSIAHVELQIMLGFYSVRKLKEARKISDRLHKLMIPLNEFKPTGKHIRYNNRIFLEEIYKMNEPKATKKPLEYICNQIVHSFIFTPGFNEEGFLEDIFFASDDKKDQVMYSIKIEDIASIFEHVGNNYPARYTFTYDSRRNHEIIRVTD